MKKIFLAVLAAALVTACMNRNIDFVITVDPETKNQFVRGFGAMDVGWGNFPQLITEDVELLFNPDTGLGLNILRVMIMPYNTDIDLGMKQLINGKPDFFEKVRIVNNYNGYVLATPWSPPREWKSNNHTKGDGSLLREYWQDYADYLRGYARIMHENGAPIYAISIQNEPDYKVDYDGCLWTGSEMRDFFKQVGRFTDGIPGFGGGKETPFVLTMNGETYQNPQINDAALDDPVSLEVIDLIGRHPYGSGLSRYAKAIDHPTHPKEVWMTEYNINSGKAGEYPKDSTWNFVWKLMNNMDLSIRLNDESAYIWWAGKRFYSFIGDGQYGAALNEIMPRGYAFSHFSKFARETWRIGVEIENTKENKNEGINRRRFNSPSYDIDSTTAKVTAFVSGDGNTISLVMFTPTTIAGTGGMDMGKIKIQLPDDFIIREAAAMRSQEGKYAKWEKVRIMDKNAAVVKLPSGHILSVRFTR